jgi:hypothetical protein
MTQSPPLESITSTLDFTLAELALNHIGQLSRHQIWVSTKLALTVGGMFFAMVAGGLVMLFLIKPTGLMRLLYGLPILGSIVFLIIAWQVIPAAWQRNVIMVEGPLSLEGLGRGMGIVIGHARVPVEWTATKVLVKGDIYRLYYVEGLNQFLSIEPVSKTP